jgi:hypothetical protein
MSDVQHKIIHKRSSGKKEKFLLIFVENHWVTITNAQHKMFLHSYSSAVGILKN